MPDKAEAVAVPLFPPEHDTPVEEADDETPAQGFNVRAQETFKLRSPLVVPVDEKSVVEVLLPIQAMVVVVVLPAIWRSCNVKCGLQLHGKFTELVSRNVPTLYRCPTIIVVPVFPDP